MSDSNRFLTKYFLCQDPMRNLFELMFDKWLPLGITFE
jgi:hypothetical protein